MTKSDHREAIKFVGMYFIDEHGEDCRTGQIIAQISDGYYLAQFDCTDDNVPAAPLEVLSAADFSKVCDNCGSRHWQFFADVKTRQGWINWLTTPDPVKDKMGKSPSQINRREAGRRAFMAFRRNFVCSGPRTCENARVRGLFGPKLRQAQTKVDRFAG
jgi:hypothetical protein